MYIYRLQHVHCVNVCVCVCVCVSPLLLQDLALSRLRITKVHDLIKKLIDEHEIVPNTLLLQFLKILTKYLQRDGEGGREGILT